MKTLAERLNEQVDPQYMLELGLELVHTAVAHHKSGYLQRKLNKNGMTKFETAYAKTIIEEGHYSIKSLEDSEAIRYFNKNILPMSLKARMRFVLKDLVYQFSNIPHIAKPQRHLNP